MTVQLAHPDIEECLLSCILHHPLAATEAASLGLTRSDFAFECNSLIYDGVERVAQRGGLVDRAVILADLTANSTLEAIGGEDVIDSVMSSPSDPVMLTEYIGSVKDAAFRRSLRQGLERSISLVHTEADLRKMSDAVQNTLYRAMDGVLSNSFNGVNGTDLRNMWELRAASQRVIAYPWRGVESVYDGTRLGELSIWGLYSSDGKSTIALRRVIHACSRGERVGFFLLEMTEEQLTVRILAYLTGIDPNRIEKEDLTLDEQQKIEDAFSTISSWELKLYCDPSITVADIRTIQQRERFSLISVDYLQRFNFENYADIPRIAKLLKNIALSTKCCVDLFSQLMPKETRHGENPFTKPDLHSLFGGKAIAFEADNVIFLWAGRLKDENGSWNGRSGYGTMYMPKVRQGIPNSEFQMMFNPRTVQWEEA